MNSLLVILISLSPLVSAAITDLNCTDGTNYDKSAFMCDDIQPEEFCTAAFPATPAPALGTADDRAPACFKDSVGPNEDVKNGALATCPKTCGYCCQSAAFTCPNKEFPRITCSEVTQTMCKDAKWRPILAEDCPAICGLCNEGGCVDAAIECANDKSICRNIDMQEFVKVNCQKTCGFCSGLSTTASYSTGNPIQNCNDHSASCSAWNTNGFCASTFYTTENKREYCARTCGLC